MAVNCAYSFDDLHQAVFGRVMTEPEKSALYALPQSERNTQVGEWARQVGWATENRRGSDGVVYAAFWPID